MGKWNGRHRWSLSQRARNSSWLRPRTLAVLGCRKDEAATYRSGSESRTPAPWVVVSSAAAAGLCCALVNGAARNIAFWTDSAAYFSAAESLKHGALLSHQNLPLTVFPPLYPVLVSMVIAAGLHRQAAAALVNAGAVVIIAGVVSRIALVRTRSVVHTAALLMAAIILGPIPSRLRYAGTELPFIALTVIILYCVDTRVWRRGVVWATSLGLLSSLAFLTRYSGVVVIAFAGAYLLADVWRLRSDRLATLASFSAGAALPCLAWLWRNCMMDGTLFGHRPTPSGTLNEALVNTASTLIDWIIPGLWWTNTPLEYLIVLSGAAVMLGLVVLIARRTPQHIRRTVDLHALFCLAYVVFIALSSLAAPMDEINERLLAPAYIPAVLALGISLLLCRRSWHPGRTRTMAVWLAVFAAMTTLAVIQSRRRRPPEVNYMSATWRDSPTTAAARELGHAHACFSNVPAALYLGSGLRCHYALAKVISH